MHLIYYEGSNNYFFFKYLIHVKKNLLFVVSTIMGNYSKYISTLKHLQSDVLYMHVNKVLFDGLHTPGFLQIDVTSNACAIVHRKNINSRMYISKIIIKKSKYYDRPE
jgi:hypothetical protein